MVLIGIANHPDLVDRFLPQLKQKSCDPVVVVFKSYTPDQLMNIITHKLEECQSSVEEGRGCAKVNDENAATNGTLSGYDGEGGGGVATKGSGAALTTTPATKSASRSISFDPKAIEICAKKVKDTGDIRKAFELVRKAFDIATTRQAKSALPSDTVTVKFVDMKEACKHLYEPKYLNSIRKLPSQGRMLLLCVAANNKDYGEGVEIQREDIIKMYVDLCNKVNQSSVSHSEYNSLLQQLCDGALLEAVKSAPVKMPKGLKRSHSQAFNSVKYRSQVSIEDIQYACEGDEIISKILDRIISGNICLTKMKRANVVLDPYDPKFTDGSLKHLPDEIRQIESEIGDGSMGDVV